MDNPTHLRSLQALELSLRFGSLKAAAQILSITPAAVGQRIKALEDYLGMPLLTRDRSGLRATPAIARVLPHLEAAFRELGTVSELLDLQRGQELHISADPDFVDLWLKERIRAFAAEHPNLLINVNGVGRAPLRAGRTDCEIRFGSTIPAQRDGRSVQPLFRDFVLPLSSPELDGRVTRRQLRERLEGFALFHVDFYNSDSQVPNWPQWVAAERYKRTSPARGIHFARISQAIEAVADGAGFALCGIALARKHLESSKLTLPFPLTAGRWTAYSFHARIDTNALLRPQIRRFRDWLAGEARVTERWLIDTVGSSPD